MERRCEPLLPNGGAVGARTTIRVRARSDEVAMARHIVSEFLFDNRVPSAIADDLELVASELVTNAVLHGEGDPIQLEIKASDEVMIVVANPAAPDDIPPVDEWSLPDAHAVTGRGLAIVRRLCDDVEVRRDGRRVLVICRRRLPDGGGAR